MEYLEIPVLSNEFVRLEPLRHEHTSDLSQAVRVGELWKTWYTRIPSPAGMDEEIQRRLDLHQDGTMVPFAVIEPSSGRAVGMTTYMAISEEHRRLEIGSTWLSRSVQHTSINPAMKLLMLQRAFEDLECLRVEFRTHWFNHQSRAAIAKLGAKQDGVLRQHEVLSNGTVRDTVIFSIVAGEWPAVMFNLESRLGLTDSLHRSRQNNSQVVS
ncbi:GNAT family N-acetyltransferase [Nesterenkonia haasae]|uniref:GNAT family N-acetyltransferase n=1 Tax=Nesterenkonia haasae TaxID=2587813 RepID=UPI0013907E0C|nr:GNAT family protein [Nesterenkonia haasae]NDK31606.1 GNAT family N-acetyltransferase [Nesterenkonia haasae]